MTDTGPDGPHSPKKESELFIESFDGVQRLKPEATKPTEKAPPAEPRNKDGAPGEAGSK